MNPEPEPVRRLKQHVNVLAAEYEDPEIVTNQVEQIRETCDELEEVVGDE